MLKYSINPSSKNLLFIAFVGLLLISMACKKTTDRPDIDNYRVVSQTEYHKGDWSSTSTFTYQNNRIVSREIETPIEKFKFEWSYDDYQVVTQQFNWNFDNWVLKTSNVYSFENDLLQSVNYREAMGELWDEYERWEFSYNGTDYKEILMGSVDDKQFMPNTKFGYAYVDEHLEYYEIYIKEAADWKLSKDLKFEYLEGSLHQITLSYSKNGSDYGEQEQFSYEYTSGKNTHVVLSIQGDSGWRQRDEIVRNYDNNGNMTDETFRLVGNPNYENRYEYEYEAGSDNFEQFPFYAQALYEYFYPSPK